MPSTRQTGPADESAAPHRACTASLMDILEEPRSNGLFASVLMLAQILVCGKVLPGCEEHQVSTRLLQW